MGNKSYPESTITAGMIMDGHPWSWPQNDGKVTVPLDVALDGISLRIDDGQEAFHTMQAFITLIQEKPKEVQAAVVDTLLKAMDPGDE